jgi:hypothetical protein
MERGQYLNSGLERVACFESASGLIRPVPGISPIGGLFATWARANPGSQPYQPSCRAIGAGWCVAILFPKQIRRGLIAWG